MNEEQDTIVVYGVAVLAPKQKAQTVTLTESTMNPLGPGGMTDHPKSARVLYCETLRFCPQSSNTPAESES